MKPYGQKMVTGHVTYLGEKRDLKSVEKYIMSSPDIRNGFWFFDDSNKHRHLRFIVKSISDQYLSSRDKIISRQPFIIRRIFFFISSSSSCFLDKGRAEIFLNALQQI